MTTAEILREARALYAANPSHVPPHVTVPAGQYCPANALYDASEGGDGFNDFNDAYNALRDAAGLGRVTIPRWNAAASTEEVLAAFDRAIAEASS